MDDRLAAMIAALREGRPTVALSGGSTPMGMAGGGRVGYEVPLSEDQALRMGVSGGGLLKDMKAGGIDAGYRTGPHSFGVELQRGNEINPRALRLRYSREF
jgi:hypothetical protein